MNLLALRTEVLNRGFDSTQYGTRITQYLNDAQNLVARRVNYYGDQDLYVFPTVVGVNAYNWPANLARVQDLFDPVSGISIPYTSLRAMDNSSQTATGAPAWYTIQGSAIRLYPIPDGVYTLNMRYWQMPPALVLDADVPSIPADWHHMLWCYATWMCFEADDDSTMGQYWQQRFNTELSMFAADQKFPDADGPTQVAGMWDAEQSLEPSSSWGFYAGW